MANPAQTISDVLLRLRLRLRRINAGTPVAGDCPPSAIGHKQRREYFDKMLRHYDDKGVKPHG
jgi:hypothetical protein